MVLFGPMPLVAPQCSTECRQIETRSVIVRRMRARPTGVHYTGARVGVQAGCLLHDIFQGIDF